MPKNYNRVNKRRQFKLNWKPSPFDARDFKSTRHLRVSAEPLPSEFTLPLTTPVYQQGGLGSCTANSGCSCYRYEAAQLGKGIEPSRLFLYYNTREIEGTAQEDSGAYIRDVFKALNKKGLCEEKYFPYIESTFRNKPTDEAYKNGLKYQTTKYTAVNKSLTTIKQTLYSGAAISFGFLVYSSFFGNWSSTTGDMPIPKKGERVEGGHACFTIDTKVSLLDGRELSFGELIDEFGDTPFWVYSYDIENKRIVPGKAHSPRKTGEQKEVLKVTLDNGEIIKCTKNHPFLMRDGTYKEAQHLQENESLMPLYRRDSDWKKMKGYEEYYDVEKGRWEFTHRTAVNEGYRYEKGLVVHHKDFNKRNNNVDNLELLTWDEHTKLHTEQTVLLEQYSKSEQGRNKSRELMKALWADPVWRENRLKQNKLNGKKVSNKLKEEGRCGFQIMDKEKLSFISKNTFKKYGCSQLHTFEANQKKSETHKKLFEEDENYRNKKRETAIKNISIYNNHKVTAIEDCGVEDVYDITVDKHHNFALSSGVFVHNCTIVGYSDAKQAFYILNSWGCYDKETEVLTDSGFKYFKDVKETDLIATLNEKGELVYHNYTDKTAYRYTGKMKKYLSSKCDLVVTPNHNMYIKNNRRDNEFKFVAADLISNKRFVVKRDASWMGKDSKYFILPGYTRKINKTKEIFIEPLELDIDLFLEFLGYFLSEGSLSVTNCRKGGRQFNINIAQTKEHNRIIIEELLKKLPFAYYKGKRDFSISNKQLYLYLSQFGLCNDKFIPKEILDLPSEKLKILFDALMLGDGSIQKPKNSYKVTYYTTSKQLCDDVQELCLKLGYTSSVYEDNRVGQKTSAGFNYNLICYQVRVQNSFEGRNIKGTKEHTILNNQEDVDYDDTVYCLTVPNHTLFVKRNGKTCWCGNSNWGKAGYFWMPYSFLLSPDASDFWCIDEIKIEDVPVPPNPPAPPIPPTPTTLGFKEGLKQVLTKPDLIKMTEPLIVKIGRLLQVETNLILTKNQNVDLVWNKLAS